MVRHHYDDYLSGRAGFEQLKLKTFELTEFLTDVLKINAPAGRFPHRVGLHQSCHGLRELRLGSCSERVGPAFNKAKQLLEVTAKSVQEIALEVGFEDPLYFSRRFRLRVGISPREYRATVIARQRGSVLELM